MILKYKSCDKAFEIARIKPSAVDIAAAIPPAATSPEITYGNPATSGVANTTTPLRMKNSLRSSVPLPFKSAINTCPTAVHSCTHLMPCTSAIDLPIIEVGIFGSIKAIFESVASIGAEKYSKKIKNNDQATDLLAELTLGVVKYLIRICGKEAVPTIIQIANEINFQAAIAPAGTPECGLEIEANPPGTPAAFNAAALFFVKPNVFSNSAILCTSSPNIK